MKFELIQTTFIFILSKNEDKVVGMFSNFEKFYEICFLFHKEIKKKTARIPKTKDKVWSGPYEVFLSLQVFTIFNQKMKSIGNLDHASPI